HDGVAHRREYFVSHPDQVAVVRLTASEPGSLSFTTTAQGSAGLTTAATADAGAQRITLSGEVEVNQLRAVMQLRLVNDGGTVTSADGASLTVAGAVSVVLVYSTGTDYENQYPSYRGEDPHERITERVDAAA